MLFRLDGRFKNADLLFDTKHPIILPVTHPLTRLIVLSEHCKSGHVGPAYRLIKTRLCFWIIHGIKNVKYYFNNFGIYTLLKAKPVSQLLTYLKTI